MTVASWISCLRIAMIPGFVWLSGAYSQSVEAGATDDRLRWMAVTTFTIAALSDSLDGFIARKFDQKSKLGAFLDPLADKGLLLSATIVLSIHSWGGENWKLPVWFAFLVILRDCIILGGIIILYKKNRFVPIKPHWIGKICTVTQMVALGWIMLKILPFSPLIPTLISSVFTIASGIIYFKQGLGLLHEQRN